MKIRKNNHLFIIVFLTVIFTCVSIGYAALNRTFTITGNSEIKENSWNVYFERPNIHSTHTKVEIIKYPTIDETASTVDFSINLNYPGLFYDFYVDIVNDGTIDAKIDSIEKSILTEEQLKYVTYTVKYYNGTEIEKGQVIQKKSNKTLKIEVMYRSDVDENDLPTTYQTLDLFFKINFVQADSNDSNKIGINYYDFKIDGVTYQYDEGMNWHAWASSKYDTLGISSNNNGKVSYGDNNYSECVLDSNGVVVKAGDLVSSSMEYHKGSCGGTSEPM